MGNKGVHMYHFAWMTDPSHGWLQVGWDLISEYKYDDISSYSYHDDLYVYLEEDRDAPKWLEFLDSKGIGYSFSDFPSHTNEDSFVRNLFTWHILSPNMLNAIASHHQVDTNTHYGSL
tara:strand:+ start:270 stop:623 length:354 start_codon:yes stop_codon:yes gene_type:complete